MSNRYKFEAPSVDWEAAARAQGFACVVCKDTPTELDREAYFATGLCLACSTSIATPKPLGQGEMLEG